MILWKTYVKCCNVQEKYSQNGGTNVGNDKCIVHPFDATNRIIPLVSNYNGDLEGTWDIVINGDGIPVGTNNSYLEKGIIYSGSPNPFTDHIEIKYGVFTTSKVAISVYNIRGEIVANLYERMLEPDKYSVLWNPHVDLPKGHYFVSILINDLQVHYIKVIRQ